MENFDIYEELLNYKSNNEKISCTTKDRYSNVLPFNNNIVKLCSRGDYINASYIKNSCFNEIFTSEIGYKELSSESLDILNQINKFFIENNIIDYIATQGPLDNMEAIYSGRDQTIGDFWRMIWENKTNVIISLTDIYDNGIKKCGSYYPYVNNEYIEIDNFTIKLDNELLLNDINVRKIEISFENETRYIHQIQYKGWVDFGIAPREKILEIIELENELHDKMGPIIVHCSAGVGRTGTYIFIKFSYHIRKYLAEFKNECEFSIIKKFLTTIFIKVLRNQRNMMVQKNSQLSLCIESLSPNFFNK